ncbi:MAG: manganese efflux pump MntP [Neisseria sp.]|uniref:manganese efflux pump MntP n=1 Tax=Neisseria sp. TaxID=192066 RepID=UPI0026DD57AD|nr:manganese efflux pump MntP [Neisseria sp.]MDO4642016.1 manganese efflux pump MntP [Neisseria sp.]
MSAYAIIILAFAMSMDAFAASVVKGAVINQPSPKEVLKIALLFGIVETITPLIGWVGGSVAQQFIADWDHWVAFTLLLLGCKMIHEGITHNNDDETQQECKKKNSYLLLLTTAIATSIDSMIVGVGLAFLDVNITVTAIAIGAATTLMSAIGVVLGRFLGAAVGKRAEIFGGIVLIIIGSSILVEHLGLFKAS